MNNTQSIKKKLDTLQKELHTTAAAYQTAKEELENFLSQFTCVLDAPSCGCSEEELNDPKFEALYTEQDRLTQLTKSYSKQVKELEEQIRNLENQLNEL